jgi:hypothetical protein
VQIGVELAVRGKILPQNILCFRHAQSGHNRETLRTDAIDHTKVQSFGEVSLVTRNLINANIENLRSGNPMKIGAGIESVSETAVAGKLRQDSQLNL